MFLLPRNSKISTSSPFLKSISKTKLPFPSLLQLLTTIPETIPNTEQENTNNDHGKEQQPINLPNKLTPSHYDNLINIAFQSKDLNELQNLLNQRTIDHCFNTRKTFNFLSRYKHDVCLLQNTVKELTTTIANIPTWVSKKHAFDTLIAFLCNLGHPEQALLVIRDMFDGNHGPPNAYTFYPLLAFHGRKNEMEKIRVLLRFMEEKGILPDLTCFNYQLNALCHLGRLSEAAELLGKMGGADSRTFDALVIGACGVGRVEGAIGLVRRMEEDGVVARYSTTRCIIGKLFELGRFYDALEFVVGMSGKNSRIDAVNFGFLGKFFLKMKMVEEARLVLKEMENRGLSDGEELGRLLADKT